jgi:hypothetical protein
VTGEARSKSPCLRCPFIALPRVYHLYATSPWNQRH